MIGAMAQQQPTDNAPQKKPAMSAPAIKVPLWYRPWLLALAFLVVTFVVYQPVWRAGFIWDDDDHLTANPAMTAPHGLRMIWSSLAVSRYYPLTLTSFWVERRLWGLNPMPYHLVNIALHAINGVLIFLVLRRLRVPAAWLAAMLWVLHPVNVESAAWVTELKNTQSGLFFFLALLWYLRFDAEEKRHWYAFALVCGTAALLSKPSTVVLPLVLLLCVWRERGRWQQKDMVRIAPFFGLALAMSVLTVIEQRGHILRTGTTEWHVGMAERLAIAGRAVWFYAAKLLCPVRLTFVYPRWEIQANTLSAWLPLAAAVATGPVLWRLRQREWARASLFGLGYFAVALLPVLGFFDVYYFRYSFVADHFQYLASAGFIALAASAGVRASQQAGWPGKQIGAVAVPATLIVLGMFTWKQGHVYQDVETLWRDTVTKNPGCWLAHNNLGVALTQAGKIEEAIGHYGQALRFKPDYVEGHCNLGIALARLDKLPEAIKQYEQALQFKPDYAAAHNGLGSALSHLGRIEEAIGQYELALKFKPDFAEAYNNLGNALQKLGKVSEAIRHYEQALKIDPDDAEAHNNLGNALLQLGKAADAIGQYQQALRFKPDDAETQNKLGAALIVAGKPREALAHLEQALRLKSDFAEAQNNLAWLLATLAPAEGGDPVRAVSLAQGACELTGNKVPGYLDTLAVAYGAAGRFNEAVTTAQKAIELGRSAGQTQFVAEVEARLELYRSGRAYR